MPIIVLFAQIGEVLVRYKQGYIITSDGSTDGGRVQPLPHEDRDIFFNESF